MFVQVIEGQVADRDGLRRQMDAWEKDLRPGATGFLGSTAGVTDDGYAICVRSVRVGGGRQGQQ